MKNVEISINNWGDRTKKIIPKNQVTKEIIEITYRQPGAIITTGWENTPYGECINFDAANDEIPFKRITKIYGIQQ